MVATIQPLPENEVEAMLAVATEWEKELLLLRQEHGVAAATLLGLGITPTIH
ncbi:MAG: hypothetical protein ABFE07_02770 [Armatimonadia bacterium]